VSGPLLLPTWEQLAVDKPCLVETMRRYLRQIACVLRPESVTDADLALRSFAAFLVERASDVMSGRRRGAPARRGLQAVAGGAARAEQATRDRCDDRAPSLSRLLCKQFSWSV
jgi:hypothetical protein